VKGKTYCLAPLNEFSSANFILCYLICRNVPVHTLTEAKQKQVICEGKNIRVNK